VNFETTAIRQGADATALLLRHIADHLAAGDTWRDGDWVPSWLGGPRRYDARANAVAALRDIAAMNERV
jgi:hypothetical protein